MNEQNKTGRRFSIKWLVISLVSLPMMMACIVIVTVSTLTLRQGMESETFKTLEALARGTMLALDGVSSGEYSMQGDDLYKGNVNLSRDMGALVINALGRGAWQVVDAAVGVDVAHETAAIKAGRWAGTAPDVRESQVFLRLPDKGRKLRVSQGLPRNVVILPGAFIGVNIISKQIRRVAR